MNDIQQEIFEKVKKEWQHRSGNENINEDFLRSLIIFADTNQDGKKRVISMRTGKTHLVPIERIILDGLKEEELEQFPVEI
jgi:hypothetical protein